MDATSEWTPDWTVALEEGETLLWTGRPEHGRRFRQMVGHEPVWYASGAVGIAVMWLSLGFIPAEGALDKTAAIIIYAAVTVMFVLAAVHMATQRQFVLCHLHYAVTDRRAIVCRRGRDVLLRDGLYFLFFPHDTGWSYPLLPGRPFDSIRVGTLLSEDAVQPFGAGLDHPGWPVLRGRVTIPVLFENIADARGLRQMLLERAEARGR